MTRILIVSEGDHEMGKGGEEGALPILAQRLAGVDFEYDHLEVRDRRVRSHRMRGVHPHEYQKRIMLWIRHAQRSDYDGLILVIDQDGKPDRQKGVDEAQVENPFELPRAIGLAIHSFDAWMLADELALSHALNTSVDTQQDPESNRDPKLDCHALRDSSPVDLGLTELYRGIARKLRLEHVESRCPKGFAVFADRLRTWFRGE